MFQIYKQYIVETCGIVWNESNKDRYSKAL